MKNFWKVLGIAALAVGFTPYKVEKDEETGENKYQALLWQATRTKGEGEEKGELNIAFGFNSPFQEEEAHLFSEDLSVEYAVPKAAPEADAEAPAEEEAPQPAEEEPAPADEPEAPAEAEAAAEETETPAEPEEPAQP